MSYRDVWKTEYTSTFEGSLVEINGLVTACETYNPKTGPLMVGPVKFLWWRPDDKQTNQKI